MIDLDERQLSAVKELLALHVPGFEVRLFGSRARGTARRYSDIDLVIIGNQPVPEHMMSQLRDAFAESDLPCRVDVLDWQVISPEFRAAIAQQDSEVVQHA